MAISISELTGMTTYRAGSNAPVSYISRIRGAIPNPVYVAVGNTGLVTWNDGGAGGTFVLSGLNSTTASYTPKNKTQAVIITATDTVPNSATKNLSVFGTMPLQPQVGVETEWDIETKTKLARDRTRYFREDGGLEIGYVYGWDNRMLIDKNELIQFWLDHRKVLLFWAVDTEGALQNQVWFISSIKAVFAGANRWNMAAGVRGLYNPIINGLTDSGELVTSGGEVVIG